MMAISATCCVLDLGRDAIFPHVYRKVTAWQTWRAWRDGKNAAVPFQNEMKIG